MTWANNFIYFSGHHWWCGFTNSWPSGLFLWGGKNPLTRIFTFRTGWFSWPAGSADQQFQCQRKNCKTDSPTCLHFDWPIPIRWSMFTNYILLLEKGQCTSLSNSHLMVRTYDPDLSVMDFPLSFTDLWSCNL